MTFTTPLLQTLLNEKGWQNQYRFILSIGQTCRISADKKIEAHLLTQCTSKTWLHLTDVNNSHFGFGFFSESKVINGLGWILLSELQSIAYHNNIGIFDQSILKNTSLNKHLSASRSHGLSQILQHANALLHTAKNTNH